MFADLLDCRELIWRFILRDITARYRQSILGYLWAILPAIATVAIFLFLTGSRTFPIAETPLPYAAYALWNIGVWQLFASSLINCTNSLAAAGSLVSKVNFPKEALVISALGQPLFDFVIRLFPVMLVFAWYDISIGPRIIFLPLILAPLIPMALGLGFLLSVVNLVLRDVGNVLSVVLTLGAFLAPIFYPPPNSWPSTLVNILNPFSPILIASQDLIARGALSMPEAFLVSCLFSTLLFFLGWRLFRIATPRVCAYA
ncbi:MAG TPA: ABC transporter permease [Candidatus Binatia bacterium]|jgi:lipopolysaccharide transport system permease protein